MIRSLLVVACTTMTAVPALAQAAGTSRARVLVSPNVLVSRDGNVPHAELMVAANPRNPKNLLGGAVTFTRAEGGLENKGYVSFDGGWSWLDIRYPEQYRIGGADPQTAFGLSGTAYFVALALDRGAMMEFYRSEDGGATWGPPLKMGSSYDHEQIVVDHSNGRFAGRIYLGALYNRPGRRYIVGVFRSDDDGRSFVGPVEAAHQPGYGINVNNLLLFSDGTLFVPYSDFHYNPDARKNDSTSAFYFVTSSDGGVSFSKPTKIHDRWRFGNPKVDRLGAQGDFASYTFPQFGVDTSARFRDRLYAAWNDYRSGRSRMLFSYSKDRGQTWTAPRPLAPEAPTSSQYQQMVTVNKDGVLGIMYYDTRDAAKNDQYHLYFSVSVDGGETFLPPVRVTSVPSTPASDINARPVPSRVVSSPEGVDVSFISAYSRYQHGGDYLGLTADATGTFHLFWTDSRLGSYQIYASRVVVTLDGTVPGMTTELEAASVNGRIGVVFDPGSYDQRTKEATLLARLKNTSSDTLYGPFTVEIASGAGQPAQADGDFPTILNAGNGKTGLGATFEYGAAVLRDIPYLAPYAVTEAIAWRVRAKSDYQTGFTLPLQVRGFVRRAKAGTAR